MKNVIDLRKKESSLAHFGVIAGEFALVTAVFGLTLLFMVALN